MWVIGVGEMYDPMCVFIDQLSGFGYMMLSAIVAKVKTEIEQEELDFNGRWCDDGGRDVE